jgi:outer membrane protein
LKKSLLTLLLLTTFSLANEKQTLSVGAGPYIQSQAYKSVDPLTLPSPVIFFDNGLFYARWSRFGVYFLGENKEQYSWGFSLTLQPRTFGYKPSDSPYLKGMQERKSTLEGGIAFSASYQKTKYIEIMLLGDMLNRYNSYITRMEIGDSYKLGNFTLYPSFILLYQSSKFLNYYYGVKENEATQNRLYYSPDSGIEMGVQTYIKYPLTKNLATLLNIRYDKLPKSAVNSPLTDRNYIYSGLFSLIYTFEY